jgi:hypothetical protein
MDEKGQCNEQMWQQYGNFNKTAHLGKLFDIVQAYLSKKPT